MSELQQVKAAKRLIMLTNLQFTVAVLCAQGHDDKQIARLLNISTSAASDRVKRAMNKAVVRNRAGLAALMALAGYVKSDEVK
jgi:DNA-binding NarL/FixJ family response regulator